MRYILHPSVSPYLKKREMWLAFDFLIPIIYYYFCFHVIYLVEYGILFCFVIKLGLCFLMHFHQQGSSHGHMRRLCPNIDRDDGLETVLEVPIPEEMFVSMGSNLGLRMQNMLTWMKAQTAEKWASPIIAARFKQLRFLLYLVGSPLIPLQVQLHNPLQRPIRDTSIVSFNHLKSVYPFRLHMDMVSKTKHPCFDCLDAGSFDCKIHCSTVYSSNRRTISSKLSS